MSCESCLCTRVAAIESKIDAIDTKFRQMVEAIESTRVAITPAEPLLLDSKAAAKTLSISARSLWDQSKPRGPIPLVKIGGSIRYSPADLAAYIEQSKGAED